jgi:hypothetical protein
MRPCVSPLLPKSEIPYPKSGVLAMTTTSRSWSPSDRDRLIYRWVKFDGHKQSWVADQLGMNQSTVSRIVDRYERWIAHGGPVREGGLSRDERLRAQIWLTYERNESIITSALRMASEMEQMSDSSKSTTKHYCSEPSREIEVRTENSIRDRTDKACRYLRLAYRVGMDQLQLLEKYDLPALEPFTLDPNEYSEALADSRSGLQSGASPFEYVRADKTYSDKSQIPNPKSEFSSAPPPPLSTSPTPAFIDSMHAVHNQQPTISSSTSADTITSVEIAPHKKPSAHAYALPLNPPKPTDPFDPILDATTHQPPPPIRILPIHLPLGAP